MIDEYPSRPDLPIGAVINGEIVITSYFNDGGEMMYAANVSGNVNLAQVLGLMALGAIAIYKDYTNQEQEEE